MRILITAGATIERIDPVRYISNFSSGKQGYAIAAIMRDANYDVTLISANVKLDEIENVKTIKVESAVQMLEASLKHIDVDVFISVAAVCDWRAANILQRKLKKDKNIDNITLNFVKNPDILKTIATHTKRPKIVIGFAAETDDLLNNAKIKLIEKNCDYIIANLADNTFGSDYNEVYCISKKLELFWPKQTKEDIAKNILQFLQNSYPIDKLHTNLV